MCPDLVSGEQGEGAYIEPAAAATSEVAETIETPTHEAGDGGEATEGAEGGDGGEGVEQTEEEKAAALAAAAYTPNFKYQVLKKEKEIPEKYRALIKNEADENELRDLFESADGLKEHFKPKYEQMERSFGLMQGDFSSLLNQVQDIRESYQRNDIDAFLQKMNVSPEKVLQWAVNKFQYRELPPEQRAQIDAQTEAQRAYYETQRQNSTLTNQLQSQIVQARQSTLNSELARPEVKAMVDAFDQRAGRAGAFVQQVYERGQLAWANSKGKVDLSPSQAIEQVVNLFGLKNAAPARAASQVASPASGGNKGAANTLPNLGSGRAASPVKKKVSSIDDIKKYYKDNYANG